MKKLLGLVVIAACGAAHPASAPPPSNRAATAPPDAAPAAAPALRDMHTECDEYLAAVARLDGCDKVPASAKDGAHQSVAVMQDDAAQADRATPDARRQMAAACRDSHDAAVRVYQGVGCP